MLFDEGRSQSVAQRASPLASVQPLLGLARGVIRPSIVENVGLRFTKPHSTRQNSISKPPLFRCIVINISLPITESPMTQRCIESSGFPPDFHHLLGQFHCMWLMFDVQIDWSIGQFLKIPTEQTHILVAGMEFGRKLRLLIELLKRSEHPRKSALIECIRTLQGAKRDIITHSYIASNSTSISFIYRSRGEYKGGRLDFQIEQFSEHVIKMVKATQNYQSALNAPGEEQIAFAMAALNI